MIRLILITFWSIRLVSLLVRLVLSMFPMNSLHIDNITVSMVLIFFNVETFGYPYGQVST